MAAMAPRGPRRSTGAFHDDAAAARDRDLRLPDECVGRGADRPMEARPMKPIRLTATHQSITFSRRMLLLGGAQAGVGALLIGRMGWLSVAQNARYPLRS